uniref:KOW domain-containing protein n=2 Tax=Spongospora subterranea TaxID=70186 RepID=A0A0H5QNG3_9EUKA|eukprot:CRZ03538.1 hypothetical protein [Spongospora subterranea]
MIVSQIVVPGRPPLSALPCRPHHQRRQPARAANVPDWVGRRVHILRGRQAGAFGTIVQYAEGKFRIVLNGIVIVKHADDVELLDDGEMMIDIDDDMIGKRVLITGGTYSGCPGVVRGRALGSYYCLGMTDRRGQLMIIMKKAEDVRLAPSDDKSTTDATMTVAANILMDMMDRRLASEQQQYLGKRQAGVQCEKNDPLAPCENRLNGQQQQAQQKSIQVPKYQYGYQVVNGSKPRTIDRIPFANRS